MTVDTLRHAFTVHDYARMQESGILGADDRVELIDGDIHTMSPIGPYHAAVVTKLVAILTRLLDDAIISPQNPVRLNDYTEPQPDVMVLRHRADYYAQAHPQAADVLLLVEVADTSGSYDRLEKLPRYAAAGIPEVWIIDLAQHVIEQHTRPVQSQYTRIEKHLSGATITSAIVPRIVVATSDVLG